MTKALVCTRNLQTLKDPGHSSKMTDAIMQMAIALFFNISSQVTFTDFFNSVFPPKHRTLDYLLCVQLR